MKRERLEELNPWWFSGRVPEELLPKFRRRLFHRLLENMGKRYVASIVGLRRTGKTTLMFQIMQQLLDNGADGASILYFNFDELVENLDELMDTYRELKNKDFRENRAYLFLDEIQKLPGWTDQLKKYYDFYPKLKFIISGSESLFVASKTKEMLAGRINEFRLNPLSFDEYARIRGEADRSSIKMKSLFSEYLENGGFPEIVAKSRLEIKDYVKSVVLDKIIFKDIAATFGVKDTETIRQLVETIASNPGMYLDYQSLAKQLGKDRRSIKSYIMLLNESFLIKMMGNYRKGKLSGMRKLKRVYPADTSVIITFNQRIDERLAGLIAETAVVNSSESNNFWKNSREVDIVDGGIPVEIKYKSNITDDDLAGIREFMRKFGARKGIVITKDLEKTVRVKEGRIDLIPAWVFLSGK